MSQLRLTAAADTTTTHTHRFKIQSTVPPNNLHIENQISIATTTPTLALDRSNSNPTDIKSNKCNIINAATTPSIKTNDETTLHELPNNNNYHDNIFNVRILPTTKVFTPMTTTTSLLWILLLITTITRAATLAIQGPVIKRGSTVCLVEETFNVFSGGQQFTTDEYPVRTWDVWLPGKQICIPADECIDNGMNDEEERVQHAKDKLQRVTLRTAATVQWMVIKSDSGDFDAEAPVGSASYEVRRGDIQCRFWEAWLSDGKGINKHIKENLQCVPQRSGATNATVQWMVLKCDAGDFDAEAPVGSATCEIRKEDIQYRYWEAWLKGNNYNADRELHGTSQCWRGEKKRNKETEKKKVNGSISESLRWRSLQLDNRWIIITAKRSIYFRVEGSEINTTATKSLSVFQY